MGLSDGTHNFRGNETGQHLVVGVITKDDDLSCNIGTRPSDSTVGVICPIVIHGRSSIREVRDILSRLLDAEASADAVTLIPNEG